MSGLSLLSANRLAVRRTALGTVSGLALCLGFGTPALAQETDAGIEEETPGGTPEAVEDNDNVIVVSGFRAALESAQNIKRDADTFVDVITAEDIGALPDRSVAEALQRVPGVNISRFEQRDDPDRFSVEGTGVIIRGLPYVRSELNGRDIFSANGGRALSFNDVSPELLGRVEVFKNQTADMIEGGIAGTVNLVTRKPLDNPGFKLAGTIEANYGDLAEEWSPGFSVLASNTFDTGIGMFGIQFGYAQQELVTRTDASQVTDPCYRADTLDAPCIRVRPVGSGGFAGEDTFDESNFPPAGSVIVPKGAGVRTTDLTRDRRAYSGIVQWESTDGRAEVTLEYLRAETEATLNEFAALAQVNDDLLFPLVAPGTTPTFRDGRVETITLTQNSPNNVTGIPTELLRFQREDDAMTEDFSANIRLSPSDRLSFNFEVQHITSDRNEDGFIAALQTFTDIYIDNSGTTPVVQFLQPGTSGSPGSYFTDPNLLYYWFNIDNQVRNEGTLDSLRMDSEYEIGDGFFKRARFGARWADRNRVTRNTNFSNWSNLGAAWTGRNGNWNGDDPQAFGPGGAYVADFPEYANIYDPFGDGFQRGNAPTPFGDGAGFFFGGDNLVEEYLSGLTEEQINQIRAFTLTPEGRPLIYNRDGLVPGTPYLPGEISDVDENSFGAYLRVDFGMDDLFGNGWVLEGNIGLRYVDTEVSTIGAISYPTPLTFDDPSNPGNTGDGDGVVTVADIRARCANTQPGQDVPGFCSLSDARLAEFASIYTGESVADNTGLSYDHWLPSLNVKLDVGGGLLFRGAVSKGLARPDLAAYRSGGGIGDNTNNLRAQGTLETGPLFQIFTGNRFLMPVESWNYDLSAEWYFNTVGSLTASLFLKEISNVVNEGAAIRSFTSPSGATTDVLVNGPYNTDEGTLKGFELAYQQSYDFLPGILSGLGSQLTYTYVDAGDFNNSTLGAEQSPFASGLPLAGVSKHTVNAVVFYEKGPLSARAAYNWRSEFLQTPRDVIFPYSPIYGESTGQLDASIFFALTDRIKLGVQGVNLLDEVTRTSQVIDFDGTRVTRSAFRNDRRYTFVARFDF
ncbi:TonB-dependent receptor [Pelagerythrobacter sp.]|uniref:TonB-dependent receptor n=1 Tax=Pelagerythrobacter sp. TaxID=2800702 RepID=UPI0035B25334